MDHDQGGVDLSMEFDRNALLFLFVVALDVPVSSAEKWAKDIIIL